jgi:hypothetical protein
MEPARNKATRKWRNHEVEKRVKEEAIKAKAAPPKPKELEVGDVIHNQKPDGRGSVIRAQTRFAKDIKEMLDGHAKRNTLLYHLSLRARIHRLKLEKLKRLEARVTQQNQEASNA